ncbi:M48 family metallopeptidase [Thalassococcus sp. BH17M4-6]|uniref:M48 family metallopeptidase n=1 Tax=Thalassococcus sp. BH17M4-6 TaxID=3413148 RepID=UPI003BC92922
MTLLRVGAAPEAFTATARYLDGVRPEAAAVRLSIDEHARALVISRDQGEALRWPLDDIREVPDQAGRDVFALRLRDDPLQRLLLEDRELEPRLPNLDLRAPVTKRGQLVLWAIAAVASVALIITVLVPRLADQLAVFIPPEGEAALGEVTLDQIRSALDRTGVNPVPVCERAAGVQALDKMRDRLVAGQDLPTDLTVHVLNHDMLNAFALPGGHIVFFDGLIDAAATPEEVAAVFAHEIGHVVSRDPTRHALRSAGSIGVLGLLFGDFAGGAVVLFLAERLIEAKYTQGAEAAADTFAHEMMLAADLSPAALAGMFERFREKGAEADGFVAHFLSHPALGDRIAAAEAAVPAQFTPQPLLTPQEWQDLRRICD